MMPPMLRRPHPGVHARPRRWLPALALLAVLSSSCSLVEIEDAPLSALDPRGPFARQIDQLFWPVFWIAAAIFVLVQGAILVAVVLFRDRPGRPEPKQVHGNTKLEVTWTLIPALILAGIAVPTVRSVFDLSECGPDAMTVQITGRQWWFEYDYPDQGVRAANVMVIPAGREICAEMTSDDVLHNFWVPQLNGKRYLVPGQTTHLRLQADQPGEYWGHCGEFCGLSHSLMRARVVAVSETEFEAWVEANRQPAAVPEEGTPAFAGWEIYQAQCVGCHNLTTAEQTFGPAEDAFRGPDLTHFASRHVFAGALLPLEGQTREEALKQWLADPPAVKPGSYMPDLNLTEADIDSLIAWLETLE